MFFNVFFYNKIKVSHCCIVLLVTPLISSFLCIISSFVPYAYVSIESIDFILLSLLALTAILSTSSANTSCFLLLNVCCDFDINLFFYKLFMIFSKIIHIKTIFFPSGLFCFPDELLLNNVDNLQI